MARKAFRHALRTDTPLPSFAIPSRTSAGVTQELDASNILEVHDLAEAIARAEQIVAARGPRSSRDVTGSSRAPVTSLSDIFESLGRPQRSRANDVREPSAARVRVTDDIAGPATPAPPPGIATPVPPRYVTMPSAFPMPSPSSSAVNVGVSSNDDAYFNPAGRIRSLADVTLDGYRPEPTLLLRAAGRRKRFSWLFVAAFLPLPVLAAIAVFASSDAASTSTLSSVAATPSTFVTSKTRLATTSATTKAAPAPALSSPNVTSTSSAPVFDVNSLPSASKR